MNRFEEAGELLAHAKKELPKIRKAYERSLEDQEVKVALRVEIKNLFENARSALDFAARGLYEKYGSSTRAKPKIYFPYASVDQSQVKFEKSARIESCIPGLSKARPDIVQALMEMQHFGAAKNMWLPEFMELNNENKHERLVPQIRRESKELRISSGGAAISLGEGASISIGRGASISIGGAIISGGQVFDVNRPPKVGGSGSVEVLRWISFEFETNAQPVIPFLETVVSGVGAIVQQLSTM
jgi:hypothetical protein